MYTHAEDISINETTASQEWPAVEKAKIEIVAAESR